MNRISRKCKLQIYQEFPSPTGVNYYECEKYEFGEWKGYASFRPQQGLTIMNSCKLNLVNLLGKVREFPSPTGVNYYESFYGVLSFDWEIISFPSPTGVNYYESLPAKP